MRGAADGNHIESVGMGVGSVDHQTDNVFLGPTRSGGLHHSAQRVDD